MVIKIEQLRILKKHIPNIEAVYLLESFFISAVTALLTIRTFLKLTGYPQVGGGDLHIAHMLWGGLLMLASLIILLTLLDGQSKKIAAILGGIGFGTFIDELGKFITSDNDYFYQPTIALIYVIFVLMYLLIRHIRNNVDYSSETYIINALEGLKEVLTSDLDIDERSRALQYLKNCDKGDFIVKTLTQIIEKAHYEKKHLSFIDNVYKTVSYRVRYIVNSKLVSRLLALFFVMVTIANFVYIGLFFIGGGTMTFIMLGYISSALVTGILVVLGLFFRLRKKFLKSYDFFQKAVLVSIFLLQYFYFMRNQLQAIIWLVIYIAVYSILKTKLAIMQRKD